MLVDREGQALLCDFGFARAIEEDATGLDTTKEAATFRYLSPELFLDFKRVRRTCASDVWAFGGLLLFVSRLHQPSCVHVIRTLYTDNDQQDTISAHSAQAYTTASYRSGSHAVRGSVRYSKPLSPAVAVQVLDDRRRSTVDDLRYPVRIISRFEHL